MNWKLEAKEKLQSYPTRLASLTSLKNELRRLKYQAEGLKSPTLGESVQSSHSAQDDRIVTNLVHQKELEQRLRETELWLGTMDSALSALTEQERLILRRMYMEGGRGNLEWLCQELELEKSMVYRRRDAALERFTSALYGI